MQTMLMRILNSLIEHTPVLAARRTVKTKWYIILAETQKNGFMEADSTNYFLK